MLSYKNLSCWFKEQLSSGCKSPSIPHPYATFNASFVFHNLKIDVYQTNSANEISASLLARLYSAHSIVFRKVAWSPWHAPLSSRCIKPLNIEKYLIIFRSRKIEGTMKHSWWISWRREIIRHGFKTSERTSAKRAKLTAKSSFSLVVFEWHAPLSRCWINAEGEVNSFLHRLPTMHAMSLSGLWTTDERCCSSPISSSNFRSHFLQTKLESLEDDALGLLRGS